MRFKVWTLTTDSENGLNTRVYTSELDAYSALRDFVVDGASDEAGDVLSALLDGRDYAGLKALASKHLDRGHDVAIVTPSTVEAAPVLPSEPTARLAALTDALMMLEHDLEALMAEQNIDYDALSIEDKKSAEGKALNEANGALYEAYDLLERSTSKLYALYPEEGESAASPAA